MADELERILDDLRNELKDLTRVLESTFKIFKKGGKEAEENQESILEMV